MLRRVVYLTVESEDPVTMTLSSYCRHNTEPVWPVSIFRHSRDCLSQICSEKKKKKGLWVWQREKKKLEHKKRGEKSDVVKVADLGHAKNGLFLQQRPCTLYALFPQCCAELCALVYTQERQPFSSSLGVCEAAPEQWDKSAPLLPQSSTPPHHHHLLLLLSQARQISGTHNGSEAEPFYPIIHLCYFSVSAGLAQRHRQ